MALITDFSTLFTTVHLVKYTAQSSGTQGNQDISNFVIGLTKVQFTSDASFNSITKVTTGFNTYYKMQGYNPITQQYENWHSMGTPLLSPPSGHTLTNISVIYTWQDR